MNKFNKGDLVTVQPPDWDKTIRQKYLRFPSHENYLGIVTGLSGSMAVVNWFRHPSNINVTVSVRESMLKRVCDGL